MSGSATPSTPSTERKILHEMGHLVVDLALSGWAGWMMIDKLNKGEQFYCEAFSKDARYTPGMPRAHWVNLGASTFGGWQAVKFGIDAGHSELRCTADPEDEPGYHGFEPGDRKIVNGLLAVDDTFDPVQFEGDCVNAAYSVIMNEFDVMWSVTKRLLGEYNSSTSIPFFYSRTDLVADFPHLQATNI